MRVSRISSRRLLALLAWLALGMAGTAHGLAIVADDRFVEARYRSQCADPISDVTVEPDFLAPFEIAPPLPSQVQQSSFEIAGDGLGFRGDAFAGVTGYSGTFEECDGDLTVKRFSQYLSRFSITFRIDGEGQLSASGRGDFELYRDGEQLPFLFVDGDEGPIDIGNDEPLALLSGEYRVNSEFFVCCNQGDGFDFTFSIRDTQVPIPEPATALLVLLGLAALRTNGRRARSTQGR